MSASDPMCQGDAPSSAADSSRPDAPLPDAPSPDHQRAGSPPRPESPLSRNMSKHFQERVRRTSTRKVTETGEAVRSGWDVLADRAPGLGPCLLILRAAFEAFGASDAPLRTDPLSKFADGMLFSAMVYVTILLNCVFMTLAADYEISHAYDDDPSVFFVHGEWYFLLFYVFELVVKFWRYRLHFFYDPSWKYNWLDIALVCASIYSIILDDLLPNFSWLRMLRILKLAKLLRVFRLIAMVKPLRAILRSIVNTLHTLAWSLCMLALILFLFALMLVLRMASYINEEGPFDDPTVEYDIRAAYGSVGLTMLHLFMVSTGESWSVYYKPLEQTGAINCMLIIFFVAFTQIAVLNIILGIFVDDAMKNMAAERDERLQQHQQEQVQMKKDLRELFLQMDLDGNYRLNRDEWHRALAQHKFKSCLDMMGFRACDVIEFLDLMCEHSEDGAIDMDTFVRSCMRFRGPASCFDMQLVLHAVEQNAAAQCRQGAEE